MEIGGQTTGTEFGYMKKRDYATRMTDAHANARLNIINVIYFPAALVVPEAEECRTQKDSTFRYKVESVAETGPTGSPRS
jgi:hypothetical protein